MLQINATLIVQMINFGLTYLLLRMLFFKPAIAAIEDEEREYETLIGHIASTATHIEHVKEHGMQQWREFKQNLAPLIPAVDKELPLHDVPGIDLPVHSSEHIDKEVEHMARVITKQVTRGI